MKIAKNFGTLLWFDVEDYITPESDDALLELLKMMENLGIRGTFKMVGEKGRIMNLRGRQDVINLLKKQEIGYHTATHSLHPVATEYLEGMGFAQGAKLFEEKEDESFKYISDLFGQQLTSYGEPGFCWTSQAFPVLRKRGVTSCISLLQNMITDMGGDAFWYCGVLQFTDIWASSRLKPGEDPEAACREADKLINSGKPFQVFCTRYHPCEYSCDGFWDAINFNYGKNATAWKPAPVCSAEEMHRRVQDLGKYLSYLLEQGAVFLTASEAVSLLQSSPAMPATETLKQLASELGCHVNFASKGEHSWSAAQLLQLMARNVCGLQPAADDWYGPESLCSSDHAGPVTPEELGRAVLNQNDWVLGYPQLPELYTLQGGKVSPVDAFATLSAAVAEGIAPNQPISLRKGIFSCADHINPDINWGPRWNIFDKDFLVPGTINNARLQTWTLRPAPTRQSSLLRV